MEGKTMNYNEFKKRVNFDVAEQYFDEVINPAYMNSPLDKDEWCKKWKKEGGIQAAYTWLIKKHNAAINDAISKDMEFSEGIEELMKRLIDISEEYSALPLRTLVIDRIGFDAYLAYKLENNMAIWDIDKQDLLRRLKK